MGEDVSELLDMIAAQMKVVQIARIKKSCRRCEKIVQEPAPSRPIPGSMAPLGHVNMHRRAVGPEPAGACFGLEV
jgi:transposase